MRFKWGVLFLLCLVLSLHSPAIAQTQSAAPPVEAPKAGFRAEYLGDLAGLEQKVVALAGAIPQEKFTWRPADGVRSVSEVLLHIANTNYTFPQMVGIAAPAGLNLKDMQSSTTDRAQIIEALKASFVHAREGVSALSDAAIEKPMPGATGWTARRALVFQLRHASEHLGQLIAYARMNGVTPPWTEEAQQRQQAPAKKP